MTGTRPPRLGALDLLRGITVAAMIVVNNPGNWNTVFPQLTHAPWNGATFADLIFPTFIFIMGTATVLRPDVPRGAHRTLAGVRSHHPACASAHHDGARAECRRRMASRRRHSRTRRAPAHRRHLSGGGGHRTEGSRQITHRDHLGPAAPALGGARRPVRDWDRVAGARRQRRRSGGPHAVRHAHAHEVRRSRGRSWPAVVHRYGVARCCGGAVAATTARVHARCGCRDLHSRAPWESRWRMAGRSFCRSTSFSGPDPSRCSEPARPR